ncbi:PLP-dependent aminotransferase family protein [Actinospica robiniae]|uniref:aminotransferase-like domain-containing protein n=1 Tax=Actinospica robiniae TaxID=304901 RepID=UPI0003FFCE06|nr:PLP-dependent aminotransferase family protein [Actinospica robiniae]
MNNDSSGAGIADALAREIEPLPSGTRIATHRELVRRFAASGTTISQALSLLTQRGLIASRPGAGTFRTETRARKPAGDTSWQSAALDRADQDLEGGALPRSFKAPALLGTLATAGPDIIDLNGGYLHPDLQPLPALTAASARASKRAGAWDRPSVSGVPELRDWFAADIGAGLGRQDILVCGAGQSALSTALRAVCRPGDAVVVESPTYPGTIAAAHAASLRTLPVPLDHDGMDVDELERTLARRRARVIVVQPLYQNPTGACLSADRRRQILAIARKYGAFVIEDDFARHLAHADAVPAPKPMIAEDEDGRVIHMRSLTKATSPNLRVGAIAARGPVLARLRSALVIDTMFVPAPLQLTALELVTAPSWKRGLATLAQALKHRREVAVAAVTATFGPHALALRPTGGYHLWVALPAHLDDANFVAAALAHDVAITPGAYYHAAETSALHVRLSYIAAPSAADVDEGIRRLAPLLAQQL